MLGHHLPLVFQHPSWTDEPFLRETIHSHSDPDSEFSESLWKPWRSGDSSSNYDLFYYSPNSSSTSSGISYDDTSIDQSAQYWTLLLLIFPVFTAAGNGLVCASVFLERNLRTVTNYFIVSLAVADIMVAVLVMPLAVYVEVNNSDWELGDILCDTWVACDVMSCTASILNLTAISVDRFTAVTRPINYAKHKNSRRMYAMLALPWLVSLAISSPIALGLNYTDRRSDTPNVCTFYNSDFLIYSSMTSFYIPCLVMTGLYWRIYLAIRRRTRNAGLRHQTGTKPPPPADRSLLRLFRRRPHLTIRDEPSAVSVSAGRGAQQRGQDRLVQFGISEMSASFADVSPDPELLHSSSQGDPAPVTIDHWPYQSPQDNGSGSRTGLAPCADGDHSLLNTAHPVPLDNGIVLRPENPGFLFKCHLSQRSLCVLPSDVDSPENATVYASSGENELPVEEKRDQWAEPSEAMTQMSSSNHLKVEQVARVSFNLRRRHVAPQIGVKGNRRAAKRERKATKTLAVVLGVFLLCWMPFFTVNIINAFCLRYDLTALQENRICQIDPWLLSFLVWLGYINSFLNPIIYTIFNAEFRRAFRKILRKPFNGFSCCCLRPK